MKRLINSSVATLFLTASTSVTAAELNLSESSLEVTDIVEPNVMFLVDDSGSMAMGVIVRDGVTVSAIRQAQGIYANRTLIPDWVWSGRNDTYFSLGGWGNNHTTAEPEVLCVGYNMLAYDPGKTYQPWGGVDDAGNAYADATLTSIRFDPYKASGYTVNLTTLGSGPFYHAWTDSDNDDAYDAGECNTSTKIYASSLSSDEQTNFANWYQYYRSRMHVMKAALSRTIENVDSVRMGLATYHSTAEVGVASMNISAASGNKLTLLQKVFEMTPWYGTELNFYNVHYSTATTMNYNGGTPSLSSTRDTLRYLACESGNIINGSASSPGSANCPVNDAASGGECQQNYLISLSDGAYTDTISGISNHDGDEDSNFDGKAFKDTYSNTLADITMDYYERDLFDDAVLADKVPATSLDQTRYPSTSGYPEDSDENPVDMHQHVASYMVSFGLEGTLSGMPSSPTDEFAWTEASANLLTKIDDLRHAAYNGRGDYINASDPDSMETALTNMLNTIASETLTSAGIELVSNELVANNFLFAVEYDSAKNSGDLKAYAVDENANISSTYTWSAAEQLDSLGYASRIIVTYDGTEGVEFDWADIDSTLQGYLNTIDSPTPTTTTTLGASRLDYLRGDTSNEGDDFDAGEFRDRPTDNGKLGDIVHSTPRYVGPPVGTRDYDDYPSGTGDTYEDYVSSYASRGGMVYVGANDGMLHAFDASTGAEKFAYLPREMFYQSYDDVNYRLSELTRPTYSHLSYVDLTPTLAHAFFDVTRGTNRTGGKKWNTVLLGGLRKGGKGYFALNVTDPTELDTVSEVESNVLWEFTSADDDRLGYTYSRPIIAMSNDTDGSGSNANKRWVAIWGNGYNNANTYGKAALFVAFIEEGQDGTWTTSSDYYVYEVGDAIAATDDADTTTVYENIPNGIGGIMGYDLDGSGTIDYVYAGDLRGNLWKFDLSSDTPGSWGADTTAVFSASYASGGVSQAQPITTAPIIMDHPDGVDEGVIVIFGTGSYMTRADISSTDVQSLYGVWDKPTDDSWAPAKTNLQEQTYTEQTSEVSGYAVRTLSGNGVDWSAEKGWYIDFDINDVDGNAVDGEKPVVGLAFRNGFGLVDSILPKSDAVCGEDGESWSLAFDPATGGTYDIPIFDINADGTFDTTDMVSINNAYTAIAGFKKDGTGISTGRTRLGSKDLVQKSQDPDDNSTSGADSGTSTDGTGDQVTEMEINTQSSAEVAGTGRLSWREFHVND